MKKIRETVATVLFLEEDTNLGVTIAYVDEPIIVRTSSEHNDKYVFSSYIILEFVTNEEEINIGDTINVVTYAHEPGDSIDINGFDYTFSIAGIHNIVTKL